MTRNRWTPAGTQDGRFLQAVEHILLAYLAHHESAQFDSCPRRRAVHGGHPHLRDIGAVADLRERA